MDLPAGRVDDKNKLYDSEEIDYMEISRIGTQYHIRYLNENLKKCIDVLDLVNREIESK